MLYLNLASVTKVSLKTISSQYPLHIRMRLDRQWQLKIAYSERIDNSLENILSSILILILLIREIRI